MLIASSQQSKKWYCRSAAPGVYAFNEKNIVDASHVLIYCVTTDIDEQYLDNLLIKEISEGLLATDTAGEYAFDTLC